MVQIFLPLRSSAGRGHFQGEWHDMPLGLCMGLMPSLVGFSQSACSTSPFVKILKLVVIKDYYESAFNAVTLKYTLNP